MWKRLLRMAGLGPKARKRPPVVTRRERNEALLRQIDERWKTKDEYAAEATRRAARCAPLDRTAAVPYARRLMKWLGRDCFGVVFVDSPYAAPLAAVALIALENGSISGAGNARNPYWRSGVAAKFRHLTSNDFLMRFDAALKEDLRSAQSRAVLQRMRSAPPTATTRWANNLRATLIRQSLNTPDYPDWDALVEDLLRQTIPQVGMRIWNGFEHHRIVGEREALSREFNLISPYLQGVFDASAVGYYSFLRNEVGIENEYFWLLAEQVDFGPIYPLANFVLVSHPPTEIHLRNGLLHRDGGAAMRYRDGFGVYALNGVALPQWLATENAADIDPARFAALGNVEARREFLRKVGPERIYRACGGKVVDKAGDYELVLLDLGGATGKWPYLKMLNPSMRVWHLEAVEKSIRTVSAALNWRNQSDLTPEQLT